MRAILYCHWYAHSPLSFYLSLFLNSSYFSDHSLDVSLYTIKIKHVLSHKIGVNLIKFLSIPLPLPNWISSNSKFLFVCFYFLLFSVSVATASYRFGLSVGKPSSPETQDWLRCPFFGLPWNRNDDGTLHCHFLFVFLVNLWSTWK